MTAVQNNLYQYILNTITNRDENYRGKGLITDYTCLRKVSTNIFSYTIHRRIPRLMFYFNIYFRFGHIPKF